MSIHPKLPFTPILFLLTALVVVPTPQAGAFEVERESLPWITVGEDGRLAYRLDDNGNTIPDFSRSGYRGGGVALPVVPVVMEMGSLGLEDETARIQEALDLVGQMPADEEGRRGALLLRKGTYLVNGTLTVPGGVVLRGEGSGEDGTLLLTNILGKRTIIWLGENSNREADALPGTAREVMDAYVPWSEPTLTLESTDDLEVGQRVLVVRPATPEWIQEIGMDRVDPPSETGERGPAWVPATFDFSIERFITAIDGNRVTLDAPLMIALDENFGGGYLQLAESHRPREVGVEHLRVLAEYPEGREQRITNIPGPAIHFASVENAWARDVVVVHADAGFRVRPESIFVTIADCQHFDPVGPIRGGFRASYTVWGQYGLVINSFARNSRHAFMTGGRVRGPTAFVDGVSEITHSDSGPHQRFAFGQLYDNIQDDHSIRVQDRGNWGTSHGWAGAQQVFWNVTSPQVVAQRAPTTQNYVVGGMIGTIAEGRLSGRMQGSFDRIGEWVEPRSLYRAQLRDRLGTDVTH